MFGDRKAQQAAHLKEIFEEDDGMDELEVDKSGKFVTHHSDAAKREIAAEVVAKKTAEAAATAQEESLQAAEAAPAAGPLSIMRVKGGKAETTAVQAGLLSTHPKLSLFQPKGGKAGGGSSGVLGMLASRAPLKILQLKIAHAKELAATGKDGFSDPYCMLYWNKKRVGKTKVARKTVNPIWDGEIFKMPYPDDISGCVLRVELWDKGPITSEWLGMVEFSGEALEEPLPPDVQDYDVVGDALKYKTKWTITGKLGMGFQVLDAPAARFLKGQDTSKRVKKENIAKRKKEKVADAQASVEAGGTARSSALLDGGIARLNTFGNKYGKEGVSVGKEQERVFSKVLLQAKDQRTERNGTELTEREQRIKASSALQKLREQRLAQKRAIEAEGGTVSKKAETANRLLAAGLKEKEKERHDASLSSEVTSGLGALLTGRVTKKKKKKKKTTKAAEMLAMDDADIDGVLKGLSSGGGSGGAVPQAKKKVVL